MLSELYETAKYRPNKKLMWEDNLLIWVYTQVFRMFLVGRQATLNALVLDKAHLKEIKGFTCGK